MVALVIQIATLYLGRNCPNDGHFLVQKKNKKGLVILCPNGDYREEPEEN